MNSEKELAAAVVAYLQPLPVYQEVGAKCGGVADIVADAGGRGWIVECKLSLSLSLLGQAIRWRRSGAALISIASPVLRRRDSAWDAVREVCKLFGLGLMNVLPGGEVREVLQAQLWARKAKRGRLWDILQDCRPVHKTFCAAGSQSGRWTPFKQTLADVKQLLDASPRELDLKEILGSVQTHYGSAAAARRSLPQWLQSRSMCPWIEWRLEGRRLLFRSKDSKKENEHGKEDRPGGAGGAAKPQLRRKRRKDNATARPAAVSEDEPSS